MPDGQPQYFYVGEPGWGEFAKAQRMVFPPSRGRLVLYRVEFYEQTTGGYKLQGVKTFLTALSMKDELLKRGYNCGG